MGLLNSHIRSGNEEHGNNAETTAAAGAKFDHFFRRRQNGLLWHGWIVRKPTWLWKSHSGDCPTCCSPAGAGERAPTSTRCHCRFAGARVEGFGVFNDFMMQCVAFPIIHHSPFIIHHSSPTSSPRISRPSALRRGWAIRFPSGSGRPGFGPSSRSLCKVRAFQPKLV